MYIYRLSDCEAAFLWPFYEGLFVIRLFAIIGILLTLSLQPRVRMRLSMWLQSGYNITSGRRLHPQLRGCIK